MVKREKKMDRRVVSVLDDQIIRQMMSKTFEDFTWDVLRNERKNLAWV